MPARLWRRAAPLRAAALLLACAVAHGGCALSYRLDSVFGTKNGERKDEVTGSVAREPMAAAGAADLSEADLVYARAAAAELLARGRNDASLTWENPSTGAHGTVTPVAMTYEQDGVTCREFLASYVRSAGQAWLQGEACRVAMGRWEVKSLKPLKRT